jgi:ubiquinone/menaquinone biosynthesis C-methylase UbiE
MLSESGIKVLDVGCGSGNFINLLAERFPKSSFTGLDYSEFGIEKANKVRVEKELSNISFTTGDAHNLPDEWTESFDFVFVYDVLHDLSDPHKALDQIYKVLKKDGCLSLKDFGFHSNPVDNAGNKCAAMHYTVSCFICLQSSMSAPPHIGYGTCWGRENLEKALIDAQFNIKEKSSTTISGSKACYLCTK